MSAARTRLGAWRRPRWKDGAFWAAVIITAVLVAVQIAFIKDRTSWFAWGGLVLQAAVTWILVSAVIRIRVGLRRGLVAGFAETDAKAASSERGTTSAEHTARSLGHVAGKAFSNWKNPDRD